MEKTVPYASIVLKLLKGPIDNVNDPKSWDTLMAYEKAVRDYFEKVGIRVHIDDQDGYAFLHQHKNDEEDDKLPRLTRQMPLSYKDTLLCVFLREKLLEKEQKDIENVYTIITKQEVYDLMMPFFPQALNQVEQFREFDKTIRNLESYGFLKEIQKSEYRIEKIIKAKISADELQEIKQRLVDATKDGNTIQSDSDES
jgi:hypothetical protein